MSAAISAILAVLQSLIPVLTSSAEASTIAAVISALENILPLVVQEIQAVAPAIKNIIQALSANPATTADQLTQLQQLDAQTDSAFEAAAAATDAGN